MGVLCWSVFSLFWYALFYVLSSFVLILTWRKELVALLLLSSGCLVTVDVLWLFFVVPWVGLQCVIVVFPDYTHLIFFKFAGVYCIGHMMLRVLNNISCDTDPSIAT